MSDEAQPSLFAESSAFRRPSAIARDQLVTVAGMSAELILRDLDEARRRKGLSKTDLAERAGTQASAVRRLFTNEERTPNLATVAALAAAVDHEVRLVPKANGHRSVVSELGEELRTVSGAPYTTILADPPWRFLNRTGKVAPEHGRLSRYDTMTTAEICSLPVGDIAATRSHLYLWVPNALIADGLAVMEAWGFTYKANLVWAKRRKDGGPDGRGVGFYFRNVTELLLFGVKGSMRTLAAGRRQVNMIETRKREHSRKPDEQYELIEACSPGPYLEMFARYPRKNWSVWGNEADEEIVPRGKQYPAYS
jgi:N6-adenosine-specific RNA methylase IME4